MDKSDIVVFGAGVVFNRFIDSGDAMSFNIVAVIDNQKLGELNGHSIDRPDVIKTVDYDLVVLTLWDNPKVIAAVATQLLSLGVERQKIRIYSYDRHKICELDEVNQLQQVANNQNVLYAFYDLNRTSETYDITSFLVTADCYKEQNNLDCVHLVVVARDDNWQAQAFYLEDVERRWRAQNIIMQSAAILPSCRGVTYTSLREEAGLLLTKENAIFPPDYNLDSPPPITVHKDFYYWWRNGVDPRKLMATTKAKQMVSQWWANNNEGFTSFLTVTMRESTLQPKRNSSVKDWQAFFEWLKSNYPDLAIVVIRDTEVAFESPPFHLSNVLYFPVAAFHMDVRMALYERAWLNMGCSNGPKQLCHLSKTASYITCKMIIEDYEGTCTERFHKREIKIGEPFDFASENQIIDWNDDSYDALISSFKTFHSKFPLTASHTTMLNYMEEGE